LGKFVTIRLKHVGGMRLITPAKSSRKSDLLLLAKQKFFMSGFHFGDLEQFECDITDYQEKPIADEITVQDLFLLWGLNRMRMYLTKK